jgi:hypothetical protein
MNDDNILRQRHKAMERAAPGIPYSAKDFQLEVLDRLAEMRSFAEALDESWNKKLQAVKEQRLLKFDSRTLIAMGHLRCLLPGTSFRMLGTLPGKIRNWRQRKRACSDWSRSRRRIRRRGSGQKFS